MARSHWEAMFRPSVSGSGPTGGPDHLYILAPVNGRLTYDHINGKLREKLPVRALALSSPLTGATPVPYPLAFRPASHPISTCLPMQHSARTDAERWHAQATFHECDRNKACHQGNLLCNPIPVLPSVSAHRNLIRQRRQMSPWRPLTSGSQRGNTSACRRCSRVSPCTTSACRTCTSARAAVPRAAAPCAVGGSTPCAPRWARAPLARGTDTHGSDYTSFPTPTDMYIHEHLRIFDIALWHAVRLAG